MDATSTLSQIAKINCTQTALQVLATALHLTSYLYPEQALVNDGDVFDYIIVGAGSAGCVIANRLTEDLMSRVLLVEAGGDPPLESDLPGLMAYLKQTPQDWDYATVYDEYSQQCHNPPYAEITRGKMLGGCSSDNYMYYVRGNPHDYNTWANITNDETWKYENVLPYFMKSEKLQDSNIWNTPYARFHGNDGYLGVTKQYANVTKKYLKAFSELGFDIVFDTNGDDILGFSEPMLTIVNGTRQSTATAFLSPIKSRPNLYVLKNTLVTKINFDEHNNTVSIDAIRENVEKITIIAKREIIVSAGSVNSPQLLMLSGIGPKTHLEDLGINVIADLPVGDNLQNHITTMTVYVMGEKKSSKTPKDPHEHPTTTTVGYVAINKSQSYPDYQIGCYILDADTLLENCAFSYAFRNEICDSFYKNAKGKEVMLAETILLHPKSRGRILLRSINPNQHPQIYARHLSNAVDLDNLITYTKDVSRIMTTSYFKEMNATFLTSPDCTLYESGSNEFWRCHTLCMATPTNHYSGTCAMGSVVDGRLRVLGVQKLRVADGSVIPKIVSGNINAPIIMIGEKVADFIKEEKK